jgi:phosphoribosylamine--glycine ligase
MRVLVIGGGAREHALVRRLLADQDAPSVLAAPGNPGIARIAPTFPISATDVEGLVGLAARERIDLTVVGPEAPLSLGIADRFAAAGRSILGPSAAAAQLESSKAFAKSFMARHGVPSARFRTCASLDEALAIAQQQPGARIGTIEVRPVLEIPDLPKSDKVTR